MAFPFAPTGSLRHVLLAGVSLSALSSGLSGAACAAAPVPLSPAWFAARVDASTAAARSGTSTGMLAQVTTATQNLATLSARLQQMRTVQMTAAAAAAASATMIPPVQPVGHPTSGASGGPVPNGLVLGGLLPATSASGTGWTGAASPTAAISASGRSEVTVTQTAPQATLTWQTFNVGSRTDLRFDQSRGGANASSWVVLNRVEDPAAAPTQVLGSITAPGKVYVLNANGILFGAGSQVDVGALIASTAALSDAQFTTTGIYGVASGASFLPSFTGALPDSTVTVQQGASIATNLPAAISAGGGYVMLLGGMVENDGEITTPSGQTVLAAGQDFILRPGYSSTSNQTATVVGSQIATDGAGSVVNAGLIQADHGDITLAGHSVTQAGVALATTSVSMRGSIHLLDAVDDTTGSITLAPGSVTAVNPDNSATTALDSQRASEIAQSAANNLLRASATSAANPQLDDVSALPDRLDLSRVEITTGGSVAFDGGSLTMSQGGQLAVSAAGRIWAGDGAQLDVSGATGAVLPASANTITVNIQGNELRDAPVNRDTRLITSQNVTVDVGSLVQIAATAADPSVRDYTPGGLLEVSGYLANVGHGIDEWAAPGGTITLAANEVVTQPTAVLNLAGGSVAVASGMVGQSFLVDTTGHLYNVNTAPADIAYAGVYDGLTQVFTRWGVTQHFGATLGAAPQVFSPGYSYGRDAGSLLVTAPTAVLEGQIQASVSNGEQQTGARAAGITDAYAYAPTTIALPGTLAVGGYTAADVLLAPAVTIVANPTPIAEGISAGSVLPAGVINTVILSAPQINTAGLGGLALTTGGSIAVTAPLTLAPGGSLSLIAPNIQVGAPVMVHAGSITIGNVATDPTGTTVPLIASGGGITIAPAVTLDLSGLYTNTASGTGVVSGEGLTAGGSLKIDSIAALAVGAGSVIDTSSGGALLPGSKQVGGPGGNVTIIANDPLYEGAPGPVRFGATLRDAGVAGGGTFSLTVPSVLVAAAAVRAAPGTVLLAPGVFQSGFSDYVINGTTSVTVAPQTIVTVAEPVYAFYGAAVGGPAANLAGSPVEAPTGTLPSQVFQLLLPPSFAENGANARLTQRKGASLAFISNNRPGLLDFGGGVIDLGAGSTIVVDAGQSVRLEAYGQITDQGRIIAPGGTVSLVNTQSAVLPVDTAPPSLSIWIDSTASIDVGGLATTALDSVGRTYGTVTAGGRITIGSDGGVDATNSQISTDAQILIRPGAVLEASGAATTIDPLAGSALQLSPLIGTPDTAPVRVATAGGSIVLSSDAGIALDGTLRAPAGGAGAAGGTLSLTLEDPAFGVTTVIPTALAVPHVITLSNTAQTLLGNADLTPGGPIPTASYGQALLSQQQLDAGGFDSVALYARDAFLFDGNVSLHQAGAITLLQGVIADSTADGLVNIAAPVVTLRGETTLIDAINASFNNQAWHPYNAPTAAQITVQADLVTLADGVRFGVSASGSDPAGINLPGFGTVTLASSSDIRFGTGSLTTPGNLVLQAADIYPLTGASAQVFAGYDEYAAATQTLTGNLFTPTGAITLLGSGDGLGTSPVPYSVGGRLALYAGQIVQAGTIQAPEGTLIVGGVGVAPGGLLVGEIPTNSFTYAVTLAPGSITSVSLAPPGPNSAGGLTIPYGGTVDGVTYLYNGAPAPVFNPSITLAAETQAVAAGAMLDLAGGGELAGAGFITGRGGSVNVLTTPLLAFDAAASTVSNPTIASAPVYAILPGYTAAYAPAGLAGTTPQGGTDPAPGSQITIGAGVPGISAGTYTLLPSSFALLPGAARVQINTGLFDSTPGVTPLGAGSYELNVGTSVANTKLRSNQPVEAILTTAAGVVLASQFDTQSYSSFQIQQAAQFGAPRPALPEDGKTLLLEYPQTPASTTALTFAGVANFAAAPALVATASTASIIYRPGQAAVGGQFGGLLDLEITADDATPTPGFTQIDASALDALHAPRLVVGGMLTTDATRPAQLDVIGTANEVIVRSGAILSGPELIVASAAVAADPQAGAVEVQSGATLTTVGASPPPYDSTAGFFYNANGYTTLVLSNGQLTFTPSTNGSPAFGPITIDQGATLTTAGTLNFITAQNLSLSDAAVYGARDLSLSVNTINIVGADATQPLPDGVTLTQALLNTLLEGNPANGTPALQSLVLSASGSINFAGSVALNAGTGSASAAGSTGLQSLVLNTPALYGAGAPGDVASLTTGTLYWNGVETEAALGASTAAASALPAGVVAGGPGTGGGTLNISAGTIVLGYGPDTTPDTQTTLDRLIEGFATVNIAASNSISGADRGTLSVYQAADALYGAAGTGGVLNISTPLLTGTAASTLAITAGGPLSLIAPPGGTSHAANGALGASVSLQGSSVEIGTEVLLNDGRFTADATGTDVSLSAPARLDLSGEAVNLLDQTRDAPGGSVTLRAAAGNVTTDPLSSIDVSASGATAGTVSVSALAGTANLQGQIFGVSSGGQASGGFAVQAGTLAQGFDALNALLDAGGLFQARSFEIGTGNLLIDQTVRAHTVNISVDAGMLTVAAAAAAAPTVPIVAIDASGAAPGAITLNAATGLTIMPGAALTAAGTVAQTDSTGAVIEADNRGTIALTATAGPVTLGLDATLDVSAPVATPLGLVTLDAPRGATSGAETGSIAINAASPVNIVGAQCIVLYGSRSYTPTDTLGTVQQTAVAGTPAGAVTLAQIDADNAQFIALTQTNPTLAAAVAGLSAYGVAYHLRPADLVQSGSASAGNLTVSGDLDLSGLRYAGAGGTNEVGLLTLRAANTLTVNGSITDGFATPGDATTATPDDNGWLLYANDPVGQAVTLPIAPLAKPVVLASGTSFSTANPVALNYSIPIGQATLGASVIVPGPVTTAADIIIPAGGVTATAAIIGPDTVAIAAAGQIIPAGTVIAAGSMLGAGTVLPVPITVAAGTIWPAGARLSLFTDQYLTLTLPKKATYTLPAGAFIPTGTSLVFSGKTTTVSLRPQTDGYKSQGLVYALANLLPAGSPSWSIDLVGGANLASSDRLAVQPSSTLAATPQSGTDPTGSVVLSDNHYTIPSSSSLDLSPSLSVIRTGTGTLNVVAGGDVDQRSLFGVYTAGTATSLATDQDAAFQTARAMADTTILGTAYKKANYSTIVAGQVAAYPDHGGDLLVRAQGSVWGDVVGGSPFGVYTTGTDNVGDWLWRQGGAGLGQDTAWHISFGSYVLPVSADGTTGFGETPILTGFTGFGALGGGNLTVDAGLDAGAQSAVNTASLSGPTGNPISQALVLAIGGTGRVTTVLGEPGSVAGGTTALTGGGSVQLDVGGTINPATLDAQSYAGIGGAVTDLRGPITITAGQLGRVDYTYDGGNNPTDPRPQDPFTTQFAVSSSGLTVLPGDGAVHINTLRDLVLTGSGDPGRTAEQALTLIDPSLKPLDAVGFAGLTSFSLWTGSTAISLFSAGGNLTPSTGAVDQAAANATPLNDAATDFRFVYPATLNAVAASGSFYFGASGAQTNTNLGYSLELAPSPTGQVSFLAAGSIFAHGYAVDMSGAAAGLNNLSGPYNPAYTDNAANPSAMGVALNVSTDAAHRGSNPDALFAFEPDTAVAGLHAAGGPPALFYAANGDIVDFQFGEVISYNLADAVSPSSWYIAAKPARIIAGQDIVGGGARPALENAPFYASSVFQTFPNERAAPIPSAASSGSLLLNDGPNDISVYAAGRDILGSYLYIAGSGLLELDAGRNLNETGASGLAFGVTKSIGQIVNANASDRTSGASIAITAGAGASGPDYAAFAGLYLNDANQADLGIPLADQPGKVQQTYQQSLYAWLQANYGYAGTQDGAPAAFSALPLSSQAVFDRSVFFMELTASGRQESDASSLFFGSYARGRTAIATLFPTVTDKTGAVIPYNGSITLDSGTLALGDGAAEQLDAGISTLAGGSVQLLSPGGADVLGVAGGPSPGASSGVVTFGSGDIDVFAQDSVLLGQSRIFTTFGGNILIWSAQGDVNAGRGAKTTTVVQPPLIAYDPFGGITKSPQAPTSGAGIATLTPIPGTVAGNVDLIAPLGTVDAGEAGIRVSGNLNIASLLVENAGNTQAASTTGKTAAPSVNVAAAAAAAAVAGSSVTAATDSVTARPQAAVQTQPSIITVEVLSAGGDGDAGGGTNGTNRRNDNQHKRRPAA